MKLSFFTPARSALARDETERASQRIAARATDDPVLCDIARQAAAICQAPEGAVTILAGDDQHVVARHGTELRHTPRAIAFCGHTAQAEDGLLCVPDATQDSRFAGNPLVWTGPHVRFYAGAALGTTVVAGSGAVCATSPYPMPSLSPRKQAALRGLARAADRRLAELVAETAETNGDQPSSS